MTDTRSILVVEDDPFLSAILKTRLESAGFSAVEYLVKRKTSVDELIARILGFLEAGDGISGGRFVP